MTTTASSQSTQRQSSSTNPAINTSAAPAMLNGASRQIAVAEEVGAVENRPAWISVTARYAAPNATPPSNDELSEGPNAVGIAIAITRKPAIAAKIEIRTTGRASDTVPVSQTKPSYIQNVTARIKRAWP